MGGRTWKGFPAGGGRWRHCPAGGKAGVAGGAVGCLVGRWDRLRKPGPAGLSPQSAKKEGAIWLPLFVGRSFFAGVLLFQPQPQLLRRDGVARLGIGERGLLRRQGLAPPGIDGLDHRLQQAGVFHQQGASELGGKHIVLVIALGAALGVVAKAHGARGEQRGLHAVDQGALVHKAHDDLVKQFRGAEYVSHDPPVLPDGGEVRKTQARRFGAVPGGDGLAQKFHGRAGKQHGQALCGRLAQGVAPGTQLGQIYDVTCNKSGKATEIHGSSDAWEKNSLTGVEFDESARRVKQAGSSYVYASYAAVLSNANKINIAQIVAQDEVTLRGVGDTVYSITVDKGHGYITFQGVDAFIGGYASIGTKQLFEVTSGMLTTTQEGTYTVELQKGNLTGTKTVTVARDASVTVDFSEFTTKATQRGAVNFSITPANAVMTIDGVETDYSQPVSLAYGKHRVQYVETVAVSQAYQTVVIDMTASSATTTAASSTKTATTAANKATTAADLTSGYTVNITAPEGAALYVDSVYIGLVPCSFHKSYGSKTITLSKSGYKTVSYTVAIANAAGNLTYAFPDMEEGSDTQ